MELKIDKKLFYLDKEEYITLHNFIRERNAIILKDSFSSLSQIRTPNNIAYDAITLENI